jgi:hypothetical protein
MVLTVFSSDVVVCAALVFTLVILECPLCSHPDPCLDR